MKMKSVIEVTTESYEEEQFLFRKFPNSWWDIRGNQAVFYFQYLQYHEVKQAIEEWEKINGKYG